MDRGRRPTKKICVTYILSFILLSAFFYYLMSDSSKNNEGITRLRGDVDAISHILSKQQREWKEKEASKFGCIAGEPQGLGTGAKLGAKQCDTRDMNAYVDSVVKRKIGSLMDDVYNLKKKIVDKRPCCANQAAEKNEAVSVIKNRINYASEDLGAKIIKVVAKPKHGANIMQTLLGLDFNANPPVNMLRPSLAAGACFCYSGWNATVAIQLAKSIVVEAIAITHVAQEMTPNLCVNTAPKDFDIYGIDTNTKKELLGQWAYNNAPNPRTQSYAVHCNHSFEKLIFVFKSNHGGDSTCIYRVEVYGKVK